MPQTTALGRGRRRLRAHVSTVCMAASMLAGANACLGPVAQAPRRHHVLWAPPDAEHDAQTLTPAATALWGPLRVDDLALAAVLDRAQVLQRLGPFEVRPWPQEVWAARPGAMLADALAQVLGRTGVFSQVSRGLGELGCAYVLEGSVQAMELDAVAPARAHLAWQLRLVRRAAPKQTVWQGAIDITTPWDGKNIGQGVTNLGRLIAQAADEAAVAIARQAQASTGAKPVTLAPPPERGDPTAPSDRPTHP